MNDREYGLIEEMLPLLVSNGEGDFTPEQKEAAHKFKKFIDHLPGGFLIYYADGNEEIIYANFALIHMFECRDTKEFLDYTGNSFKGIVYHEDYVAVESSIAHQISTAIDTKLDYVEYRILTKNGNLRHVEDYGHYIETNVGNIFYVFITDVTDKTTKRQKEHLQRLEVIEGLSLTYDSILYIDLDTDSVFPYRMSQRLAKQFDGSIKEKKFSLVAEDFVNTWVHPDDQEPIRTVLAAEYIRKELLNNRAFHVNFKCVQDDKVQYMQLRLVDVKDTGRISKVVLGSRNVDEEIQQEMHQKTLLEKALEDAKAASAAKNSFLSNISHDMRTPLNAIFGYVELAKKGLGDKATLEKYLDKVSAAGRQLLDLVEKVLEISYLESKDFRFKEELCNLADITDKICEELRPAVNKKNIEFTVEHLGIVHPEVYTDSEQLKQIIINIASNAVKYTEKGGKIKVILQEIISSSTEFTTFWFIVQDTGIGIAPESLEKIFEPFEREKNSTQSGVFGSGLGLTIAKQIIESMGGSITAESQLGVGSTFTVKLSFKIAQKKENTSDTADVEEFLKGKKILLVEDNELNLEIETELLEDLGLIIEPAENGQIAVDKMKIAKPGEYLFVLMDIQMPVMDGWQATDEIRRLENPELANIPIIALSANAFESDKRMSAETGMNAHLNKPIDIPLLLNAIRKTVMNK